MWLSWPASSDSSPSVRPRRARWATCATSSRERPATARRIPAGPCQSRVGLAKWRSRESKKAVPKWRRPSEGPEVRLALPGAALLAGVDVLDAVALVLERRAIGARERGPAAVLAVVLVRGNLVRLEVIDVTVEVHEVGLDVVRRIARADVHSEA